MIRLYTRLCQVCTISQVRVEKYKRSLFSHAFCQHVHLSLCNVLEFPVQRLEARLGNVKASHFHLAWLHCPRWPIYQISY